MNLLVTGGAGRLGRRLCDLLYKNNINIRVFDLPTILDLSPIPDKYDAFPGDVTDKNDIESACEDIDGVFHLAAILPPSSENDTVTTLKVNVEGTRNIINTLSVKESIPLIFASSISTYGVTFNDKPPIREDHPLEPHNSYARSKILAEKLIQESGIPHTILRIAPLSIADLIELPEVVPYRADQRVEFVYIDDVAEALFSSFVDPEARGGVYNIAGGPTWQMTGSEFITKYYSALGVEVDPNYSKEYTAVDWYDTSNSRFLGYQNYTFNMLQKNLKIVAKRLGLIGE